MLEMMPESQGNILGFWARGHVTWQDVHQSLAPRLESVVQDWGGARLLLCLEEDFQGLDLRAVKDEAFSHRHRDNIEKIAVAGGPKWFRLEVRLAASFLPGEVQTFAREELSAAWEWVRA
jgi:hypothetical protein